MPLTPVDTTTPQPNGKFGDPIKTGFEKLNANDTYLESLANSKAPGGALITALAGLTTAANKGLYFTGSNVPATYDLSPQGRTLLAATTTAAQRTALGLGSAAVAALLGTVSQSGGTPTGAVMEAGSNVNGRYWRFANGLQVSYGLLGPINLASGAVYNSPAISFPAAFAGGAPAVLAQVNSDFNYYVSSGVESGITGTGFRYAVRNGYSAAINAIYVMAIAVGSWY